MADDEAIVAAIRHVLTARLHATVDAVASDLATDITVAMLVPDLTAEPTR